MVVLPGPRAAAPYTGVDWHACDIGAPGAVVSTVKPSVAAADGPLPTASVCVAVTV